MIFEKKNLIFVKSCEETTKTIKTKDGDLVLYKLKRSINDYDIEDEYTTRPVEIGYYYPRPYTKEYTLVNYKGEQYKSRITIARVGERYEFAL